MPEQDITPILVVVDRDRYQCYGAETPRSHELTKILKDLGGVSDTVSDGRYNFNVTLIEETVYATLFPVTE